MFNCRSVFFYFLFVKFSLSQLEDNQLPTCSKEQFLCDSGECTQNYYKCDGYEDCMDGSDENLLACANHRCPSEIGFQCEYGGCIELEKKCDGIIDCKDQSDEDQTLCGYSKPIRTGCKKPTKVTNAKCMVIDCKSGVKIRNCTDYMDTRNICIEITCNQGYILSEYKLRFTSRCVEDQWEPELPECQECGIDNRITLSILNGNEVSRPVPWHAGLYRMKDGEALYKCGGTIAHSKAIITAAHCVKNFDHFRIVKDKFPLNELRVAVGKIWQNYFAEEKHQQKFEVIGIKITHYRPSHKYDIAILILNKKIIPNPAVMPICLGVPSDYYRWQSWKQGPDLRGTVVGWGKTDNGRYSEILKETSSNVCCNYEVCRTYVDQSYITMVTDDKFCIEGMSVDEGDSGGGFIITKQNLHYLYGIVSVRAGRMGLFTLFAHHSSWAFEKLVVL